MALVFPILKPDYLKSISLPDFALRIKEFEDGGEIRRSSQTSGSGTKLMLSYLFRRHTGTARMIEFYGQAKGTWLSFTLPSIIISHPDNIKLGLINLNDTTFWRFAEPIQIKPDYSNPERGLYSFDVTIQSVVS